MLLLTDGAPQKNQKSLGGTEKCFLFWGDPTRLFFQIFFIRMHRAHLACVSGASARFFSPNESRLLVQV